MPTETQLEQRVAALQSDLNARDHALDDAATENNERELSRRDWFEEAQRLQAELDKRPSQVAMSLQTKIKRLEASEWAELRALLAQPAPECRCKRYGKDNPHWPCPAHSAGAEQHQGEPVHMVRTHGSCCWEEVGNGSLEDFQSMPEEYELRALYTRPGALPAAVVPEGWKLVPTVPTDDMIVAFSEAWYSKRQTIDDPDMLDAYRDMLAVAPSPPQQ